MALLAPRLAATAIVGLSLVCSSCGIVLDLGASGSSGPSGAYVALSSSRSTANELGAFLTHPTEEESTALASGLQFVAYVPDSAQVFGIRVVFHDSADEADRDAFVERAHEIGVDVVWLGDNDLWPDCAGEPDCTTVGDTVN